MPCNRYRRWWYTTMWVSWYGDDEMLVYYMCIPMVWSCDHTMLCTDIQYMVCVQHTVVCCMVYATYGSIYMCTSCVWHVIHMCMSMVSWYAWYHGMCTYLYGMYVHTYVCMCAYCTPGSGVYVLQGLVRRVPCILYKCIVCMCTMYTSCVWYVIHHVYAMVSWYAWYHGMCIYIPMVWYTYLYTVYTICVYVPVYKRGTPYTM